jgi:hypothetical protein
MQNHGGNSARSRITGLAKIGSRQSNRRRTGANRFGLSLLLLFLAVSVAGALKGYGEVALLVEEPYGFFGSIVPTGHTAIYLNHICAESPTTLRRCYPGETGVVISRYFRIRKLDWVAIPLLPYLYAVENSKDVPEQTDLASVQTMRQQYAENHLESLASTSQEYDRRNVWPQLLGVAYIRKIYSFQTSTTPDQDNRLIDQFNERANSEKFNIFTNNCADFSRNLINFYFPRAINKSIMADFAITTPKQVAKSLAAYIRHHRELESSEIIIAQIPGTIHRSHTPRGVVESLLKTMKYALPIAVIQPYILAGVAVTYLTMGRFDLSNNAQIVPVMDQEQILASGTVNDRKGTLYANTQSIQPQQSADCDPNLNTHRDLSPAWCITEP